MTPAEFQAAFPEFVDEKTGDVQRQLDAAVPFFDVGRWDVLYLEGLGNFVAHRIVVERTRKASKSESTLKGNVVNEVGGGLTTTRAAEILKMEAEDPYTSTTYGKTYKRLARQVGMGGLAI